MASLNATGPVDGVSLNRTQPPDSNIKCKKCNHGNKVTVDFLDGTFTFHSQWLHDARCDDGAARDASIAICEQPVSTVHVENVRISGRGAGMVLEVTWDDGLNSKFPVPWLQVMAPLVARADSPQLVRKEPIPKGWLVETLDIPKISYHELFGEGMKQEQLDAIILSVLDKILSPSAPGIVKIVDLPAPNIDDEKNHINNLNTLVLKRLFGSVFIHPIRGSDQTFNVSSQDHDATRKEGLANYDTTKLLLPHSDHAFYDNPIQVQGFYCLEGESENTWVSVLACLETLKIESPESYEHLCKAPMTVGRVSRFYGDPLYQATIDTPITTQPGFPDQIKRIRWHPNLTGSLLAPYDDYKAARLAHQNFQEIMRRDTHQLKILFKPGDLYVWDNFRVLHGREKVLETPRTGVGQTVPEQVVHDRYRALAVKSLKGVVGEEWLVHMPMTQLRELVGIMKDG